MRENKAAALTIALIVIGVIAVSAASYLTIQGEKAAEIQPQDVLKDIMQEGTTQTQEENATTYDNSSRIHISVQEYLANRTQQIDNIKQLFDLSNQTLSFVDECIDELDVHIYRIKNTTLADVQTEYMNKMNDDGYNITIFKNKEGNGWQGTLLFAQKGIYGRGIILGSGALIEQLLDCDIVIITSHGMLLTYEKWRNIYEENFVEEKE